MSVPPAGSYYVQSSYFSLSPEEELNLWLTYVESFADSSSPDDLDSLGKLVFCFPYHIPLYSSKIQDVLNAVMQIREDKQYNPNLMEMVRKAKSPAG